MYLTLPMGEPKLVRSATGVIHLLVRPQFERLALINNGICDQREGSSAEVTLQQNDSEPDDRRAAQ